MPYDFSCNLWSDQDGPFFRNVQFNPIKQKGPHCVSTTLAVLTGKIPEYFQSIINTQDPVSWSEALKPFRKKLAYCPTDVRKIKDYLPELVKFDDLFLLCYYSASGDPLADPDENGWVCRSHVVILHRNQIIDSEKGKVIPSNDHEAQLCHTKRIFRVVPVEHTRGL